MEIVPILPLLGFLFVMGVALMAPTEIRSRAQSVGRKDLEHVEQIHLRTELNERRLSQLL